VTGALSIAAAHLINYLSGRGAHRHGADCACEAAGE